MTADLLITGATLLVTMDDERRELPGGWVAVQDGLVSAVGGAQDQPPAAQEELSAQDCLVTPGLINTHHHIYQNLTRAYRPTTRASLFDWLTGLYPLWAGLDEEASYLSAWVGLAELALGGCTTSTDHLYVHPRGAGDLISAEISAARELGMRFHPTRGSMSLSQKDGGLPPDSVVQDDDEILADSEALVARHHDPSWGAMVRIALAPCSPFSVTPELMRRTAELAERLDVRLHTHLAEDPDEDLFAARTFGRRTIDQFEEVGWLTDRSWVAHCIYPDDGEIARLGAAGVGVAHCPSSNMMIGGGGIAPVRAMRAAGVNVGLGCDGSSSTDSASLWMEARNAMLVGRLREGPTAMGARDALEIATLGSAACLGRLGELGVLRPGAVADLVCWPLTGLAFAGALTDPVEAWLRCGPVSARHTVVAGKTVVRGGELTAPGLDDVLRRHSAAAARLQRLG
ncbi:cytosine/adenosine deaminase-related metal-dependent hydrolase [Motilibacter rhizosphaerae]|uniref:Cytosine/adenosine deaminase-related metal-dependent hydrolase n=1 Tax=Motilibacter rhizosphaerae TaxID=598652 RepID=A0A4Q7NWI5_9ACTN|nr:8-oxoguanine deaminase [Motilibacter rhizosphaerae]RZS91676.1 cytosine/adenosine deaminase-related metal-dependent hydrolase [Motilibacter rhizosphaerae]